MKIYKIAKFTLPNLTYQCGYCKGKLQVKDVTHNPKHFFNPGQLFSCSCGKSQVWANSVRRLDKLVQYCDGGLEAGTTDHPEGSGFCCDEFCPKCWGSFGALKNSVLIYNEKAYYYRDAYGETGLSSIMEGEEIYSRINSGEIVRADIWGCSTCSDNQLVIHLGVSGGELEGQKYLARWYKENQNMWRNKV